MSAIWRNTSLSQRFGCALLTSAVSLGAGFAPAIGAPPNVEQMLAGPTAGSPAFTWDPSNDLRRTLYQRRVYSDCPGSAFICDVSIETVPRNRRLDITNISCILLSTGAPAFLMLTGGDMHAFFMPQPKAPTYAVFSSETRFSIEERTEFHLTYFSTSNIIEINCSMSGEMVRLG